MRISEYGGKPITFDYTIYIKDPTMRISATAKKTLLVRMKILREKAGKIEWFEFLPVHPEGRLESRGFSRLASLVPVTMEPIPTPHSFPLK